MRRLLPVLLILAAFAVPQARAASGPQRFVVFFTDWSAALDSAATSVVANAAQWAVAHPKAEVAVAGAADLTGGRRANRLLSDLRAQVVADQLVQDGVPAGRLAVRGLGSVGYALSSQESRRVIITVGTP